MNIRKICGKRKKRAYSSCWFPWLLLGLWMSAILCLSAQSAAESNNLSINTANYVKYLLKLLGIDRIDGIEMLNFIIRKSAHFFVYMVLGLLTVLSFDKSGVEGIPSTLYAVLICVSYALFDELFQLSVPGRAGMFTDVIIDSIGAISGITIYNTVNKVFRSRAQYRLLT